MNTKPGFFARIRDAVIAFLLLPLPMLTLCVALGGSSSASADLLTAPGIEIYDRVPKNPNDFSKGFYAYDWSQKRRMIPEVLKAGASEVGFRQRVVVIDVRRDWSVDSLAPTCADNGSGWRIFPVAADQWEDGERSYLVIMPNTIPLKEGRIVVRLADGSCVTPNEE